MNRNIAPIILCLFISLATISCNNKNITNTETANSKEKIAAAEKQKITQGPDGPDRKPQTPATNQSTTSGSQRASKSTSRPATEIANDFPFDIALKDADGNSFQSDKIFKKNGKPTVLLFWLTTCAPCHRKMNAIDQVYDKWQSEADFNLFAISGDYQKNYESFVSQVQKKGWKWETYNDWNREFRQVLPGELNGYPQTFIFDKNGELVYQDKRYRTGDETKLLNKIKEIGKS